jgi:hypothetical protein
MSDEKTAKRSVENVIAVALDRSGGRLPTEGPHWRVWDAQNIIAALSEAGFVITQLPKPTSERYEGDEHEPVDRKAWKAGADFETSVWYPNQVQLSVYMDVWEAFEPFSAGNARELAAALLAAAEEADQ